ncbi:ferrichrome ABC transporter permease, partial [Listeria monocytogenes]|nr:ferrichrome ABC transporter permease [Listeria monocytogenes]
MDKSKQIKMNTRPTVAKFILSGGILLLLILALFGIAVGAADINLSTVWDALFHYNSSDTQHQIIRSLRVPRVVADMAIGAAFAVAGAIMQGITRNPLADSGLLGLNAGSTFMVAVCFAFMPWLSYNSLILFSFVGAAIGAFLVFGVSSLAGSAMSPTRLVLAGAAVSSLLTALSEG